MKTNEKNEGRVLFRYGALCALEKLPERYPVTLCGDIAEVTKLAAEAGAEAIELHIRDPIRYRSAELSAAAGAHGLSFAAITTGLEYVLNGLNLISDDKESRKKAVKRLMEHIDLAEKIECPAIVIGVMRGNIPDFDRYEEYEGRLTDAVLELSDYAEKRHVGLLIEGINRYVANYLCSVSETLRYIEKINRRNVRIHIDTHQMNIEESNFVKAIVACAGRLGYVHFSDNNRACPGGGNIDFLPVLKALHEISYDGFIGIEGTESAPGTGILKASIEMMRELENRIIRS